MKFYIINEKYVTGKTMHDIRGLTEKKMFQLLNDFSYVTLFEKTVVITAWQQSRGHSSAWII